jgi:hypothetical protein
MTRILVPLTSALVVLASGLVHGVLSDRWSNRSEQLVIGARERLATFPMQVGEWEGVQQEFSEFEKGSVEGDHVSRGYVNRLNGAAVGMLMAAGHSRNVWQWHTPEQCYPAQGFELAAPIARTVAAADGVQAEFFWADFTRPLGATPEHVRVFWAFSGDGRWLASDLPKLTFGQYASLYKVYVTRKLRRPGESLDNDPCLDFLRVALPRLNDTFFPSSLNGP